MKLMSTSSSNPRSSVTRLAIQGFITSILTFDMSTRWSSSGANFCVLSSFACLLEKRVSWSADVPRKKPPDIFADADAAAAAGGQEAAWERRGGAGD
jgi:hypothetical protein